MKSKKGEMTANEIASTILAVVILLGLTVVLVMLYKSYNEGERTSADKLLNIIVERVEDAEEGEVEGFTIRGLKDWYLVGWNKKDGADIKPDKCFLESCICICKDLPVSGNLKEQNAKVCNDNGICKNLKEDEVIINNIEKYTNTEISLSRIDFGKGLHKLTVSKEAKRVEITETETIGEYRYDGPQGPIPIGG
ncbi:MAG: hypothetical protein Q7S27_04355 [Nanoarchaeota archaeon]|nr:hypothetical protein [Nanoarchaeota archaeon]